MNEKFYRNLQLFADGEVATGSVPTGTTEGQVAADNQVDAATTDAGAEYEANYKSMIASPEYKPIHEKYFKQEMGKRLKSKDKKIADLEAYKGGTTPLLEKLAVKYGVEDITDIEAISRAADEDTSFYEKYAYEHNVDVPTAKQLIRAEQITKENERRIAEEQEMAAFQQQYDAWMQQAAQTQAFYPDFDFDFEVNSEFTGEQFKRLLNSGVDVRTAYEVVHRDEMMGGAMQYAYNAAQREIADSRTARTQRPKENGTSNQQASAVVDDMSKLSKADRQKIRAAVSRGEKVTPENFRNYLN